jgi:crotonobetainyl-CoA:carnitine CoA-transferase CaiB-like acyl-CoA transferase
MFALLRGITVLEFGSVVMGPYAGQTLADLGADVIKIEPLTGDIARTAHPNAGEAGALFVNNNRNKRSIALDLKSPRSRAVLDRLIARSDVLLHNMRRDAAVRAGIGFESASALNPEIVYCAAVGFGEKGRYRNRPAYDDIMQAASGVANLSQHLGGDPAFVPTVLADKLGSLHAVQGVLAALFAKARGKTGPIQIEVPMFETTVAFLLNEHLAGATGGEASDVGYPRLFHEHRRPHRTADGWIAVLPYTLTQWTNFLTEIDREDIAHAAWFADPAARHARLAELYGIIADAIATRTTEAWLERLTALDIPCSDVATLETLLSDPHLQDVDFFNPGPNYPPSIRRSIGHPISFSPNDSAPDQPPPQLGAHSCEILADHGFTDAEIAALLADATVAAPSTGETVLKTRNVG